MIDTEILLVGFGFSAIPLLRELDISGVEYTIVSEKDGSIWANLDRANGLDFDLVSSYYTSFYTFDLVEEFSEDRYPTAREFYDMHLRYYEKYADKITHDFVTRIENGVDHSLVHTRSGQCYRARRVVISTAFRRKVHDSLEHFDFDIENETVVLDTIGDSANLIIAKLVTGGNRIICLQNGFLPLDKLFQMGDTKYSLDQLEAHQTATHFRRLYSSVIDFNFQKMYKILPRSRFPAAVMAIARAARLLLGRIFTPHNFHVRFEHTLRGYPADHKPQVPIPNGVIVIKYWPIDQYEREFGENLSENIERGYLLNDLPFFVSEGMVALWPKRETTIDALRRTISCGGETIGYDHFIEGDTEVPNLPRITYRREGREVEYAYEYRDNYLGVIPQELEGIYLLGYTRPTTGGLSNITEMQGLFIHRLLTDREFEEQTRAGMADALAVYNRKYYPTTEPTPRDHLTFFGFYTEEVAKVLGIEVRLSSCRSLRDVAKYFAYPNNADRYRQEGRYKIEGAREFIDHVFDAHKGFRLVRQLMVHYVLYHLLAVGVFASLYLHGWISGAVLAGAIVLQWLFGYWAMIPVANTMPYFGAKLAIAAFYPFMLLHPVSALLLFPVDFAVTYLLRQLPSARYPFNDLKNKRNYRSFYRRYRDAYNELRRSTRTPERVAASVERAS